MKNGRYDPVQQGDVELLRNPLGDKKVKLDQKIEKVVKC